MRSPIRVSQRIVPILMQSVSIYLAGIVWQIVMHGHPTSDPAWYVVAVPVLLLLGICLNWALRKLGGE